MIDDDMIAIVLALGILTLVIVFYVWWGV